MVQTSDQTQPNSSRSVKRWVLLVAIFGQFMGPFDSSVVALGLKTIGSNLGGNITSVSWVITGYVIMLATFSLSSGRLADIYGRKNTYALGIAIFVSASALCGLSSSVNELIVTRVVQGLGASMMSGNSIALLSTFFPGNERGRALGISSASVYTGLSVGPPAGGFLIQYLGWRSIFYVNVPIGLAVLLITLFLIRGEMPKGKIEKFDVRGAVIYGGSIFMSLIGLSYLGSAFSQALPILITGLALLFVFIIVESKSEHPLLDLRLFIKNRLFTFTVTTAFLNYSSTFGISVVMALYLQIGLGYGPAFAGVILLAQPLFQVASAPIGGYISDRLEPRYQTSVSLAIMCASIFSLSTLGPSSTPLEIVVRLGVLGLAYGFFSPANSNAAIGTVTKSQYGIAAGILSTMRNTGQAISLAVVTYVISASLHESASDTAALQLVSPHLIILASRDTFIFLGVISAAAIFTSLNRGRKEEKELSRTKN